MPLKPPAESFSGLPLSGKSLSLPRPRRRRLSGGKPASPEASAAPPRTRNTSRALAFAYAEKGEWAYFWKGAGLDSRERERRLARRILVVDDDPLVLSILSDMLEDLGCKVVIARSAQEALEVLSSDSSIEIL
jgi:CheY-like chemotaxis protein